MRRLARKLLVGFLRLVVRVLTWKLLLAALAIKAATFAGERAVDWLQSAEDLAARLEG